MKKETFFRITTLVYLVIVAILCFYNFKRTATEQYFILGLEADKIVHFLMFFPFAILTMNSLKEKGRTVIGTMAIITLIFIIGCLVAGSTEYIQSKLPYRCMDINDFKADTLGLACGAIVIFIMEVFRRTRSANR